MREHITKLYTFNELSDESKEVALDQCRYFQVNDSFWYEDILYDWFNTLGINVVSFNIDYGTIETVIEYPSNKEIAYAILSEYGKQCELYSIASNYLYSLHWCKKDKKNRRSYGRSTICFNREEIDQEFLNNIDQEFLAILRNEYEYLISDESVKEMISCNEYELTEDGKIY